jgi:hypothetical protein
MDLGHIDSNTVRLKKLYVETFLKTNQDFDWSPCAQMCGLAETPQPPPLPPHLGSYTRSLLVSQDRRHLFVTPCLGSVSWSLLAISDRKTV